MKKFLALASLVVFIAAACSKKTASGPAASAPAPSSGLTQSDADRASAKFPGATLASLQEGQTLYTANCGKCHQLFDPKSRDEAAWRQIVPPMAKKARLDGDAEAKILAYVVTVSQAR